MITFFRNSLLIVISLFSLIFSQNYSLSFDGVDDYIDLEGIPSGLNSFSYMGWYKKFEASNEGQPIINTPNGDVHFSQDGQTLYAKAYQDRNGGSPFYEVGTTDFGELFPILKTLNGKI